MGDHDLVKLKQEMRRRRSRLGQSKQVRQAVHDWNSELIAQFGVRDGRLKVPTFQDDPRAFLELYDHPSVGKIADLTIANYEHHFDEGHRARTRFTTAWALRENGDDTRKAGHQYNYYDHQFQMCRLMLHAHDKPEPVMLSQANVHDTLEKAIETTLTRKYGERKLHSIQAEDQDDAKRDIQSTFSYHQTRLLTELRGFSAVRLNGTTVFEDDDTRIQVNQAYMTKTRLILDANGELMEPDFPTYVRHPLLDPNPFVSRDYYIVKNIDSTQNNNSLVDGDRNPEIDLITQLRQIWQRIFMLAIEADVMRAPELIAAHYFSRGQSYMLPEREISQERWGHLPEVIEPSFDMLVKSTHKESARIYNQTMNTLGQFWKRPFYFVSAYLYEKAGGLNGATGPGRTKFEKEENPILWYLTNHPPLQQPFYNLDGTAGRNAAYIVGNLWKELDLTPPEKLPDQVLSKDALVGRQMMRRMYRDREFAPILFMNVEDIEELSSNPEPEKSKSFASAMML